MTWTIWSRRLVLTALGICVALVASIPITVPIEDARSIPPPESALRVGDTASPVGGIFAGSAAIQQFPAAGTAIHSIALQLATYGRVNRGTARVTVQAYVNDRWQELATRTIAKDTLADNAYRVLVFTPQLPVARGQPVRITLRSDDGANDAITWWTNPTWRAEGYALTYGGGPQRGTAIFRVEYAVSTRPLIAALRPLWQRTTVFLDPVWRVALLVSLGLAVGGVGALVAFRAR